MNVSNGPRDRGPQLTAETLVVLNVLHFDDGTASGTLHMAGPLLNRPKIVAAMLRDHANELDPPIVTPDRPRR